MGIGVSTAAGTQANVSVAASGTQFLVAFEDRRDAAVSGDTRPDIFGLRVGSDGVILDPGGFEIAGDALHAGVVQEIPEHDQQLGVPGPEGAESDPGHPGRSGRARGRGAPRSPCRSPTSPSTSTCASQ